MMDLYTSPLDTNSRTLRRCWYDVRKDVFFASHNHSLQISETPELFRLTQRDIQAHEKHPDYDCDLLFLAMRQGYVRFLMNFSGRPQDNNIEASRISDLRRASKSLLLVSPEEEELSLVHRVGSRDTDVFIYKLRQQEDIVHFAEGGPLQPPILTPATIEAARKT